MGIWKKVGQGVKKGVNSAKEAVKAEKKRLKKAAKAEKKRLKKAGHVGQDMVHKTAQVAHTMVEKSVQIVEEVIPGSTTIIQSALHKADKAVGTVEDIAKNLAHNLEKDPRKIRNTITRILVEDKINDAFKKKMHKAIENVENELAARKAQDKAEIDKTVANKINEVTIAYLNQTGRTALDEEEQQFVEAIRLATAAGYDCRFGLKDSIEELITLERDDYAVVQFMEKRPLRLTLEDFENHQNSDALSVLLPHFDEKFDTLSLENQNDYSILKAHVETELGYSAGKAEEENYFSNMVRIISRDARAGIIKISNGGIVINRPDSTVENTQTTDALILRPSM